jgi:Xaa-Pro aminopeptidase
MQTSYALCTKTRLAAVLIALSATSTRASEFSDDLTARRSRVMERLGPDAVLVMTSAPRRTYSRDIDYEYRQDSNLYYLTGITQDNTFLVLMPGNRTRREVLFVEDKDPSREHWRGLRLSHDDAAARTGIRTVLSSDQFEAFLAAMLSRAPLAGVDENEAAAFFDAIGAGRARVALLMEAGGLRDPLTRSQELARRLRERFVGFQVVDATPVLTDLRLVKTPYERQLLAKAARISADGQLAGMRQARPGVYEYQVRAAIEAVHRGQGALSWAYPSIVGSGPNATILHYPESGRQMQPGDLLLVDAACNYEYMSPDITRTYPVGGAFTRPQKDLYAIVLQAQDEAARVAKEGSSLAAIHNKAVEVIKAGLLRLGLITDTTGNQYRMWSTHGTTHYIGIDVHDVGDNARALLPGMAFVIEPGIYIRQSAVDTLPRTAENAALIATIQSAVNTYADLGVRVEDSFILEETGLMRLSDAVPRTIDDIETFMRQRPRLPTSGAR